MKLIADDKIPYITDFFTSCGRIILLPGESISHNDVLDADILLTRTVTPINAQLLNNSSVRFVGTATTGTDHIDTNWLSQQAIFLATAAGANAQAVTEYVLYCVAALQEKKYLSGKNLTAGIIGCGRIGRLLARALKELGFNVICYDPLLTEKPPFDFVTLDDLIANSDLITVHTPLTQSGLFPTYHMINDASLKKIKSNAVLINTSRGSVVDQNALLPKKNITLCLDVWENEPALSLALLNKVFIGTPHIAGYSLDAKYRATEMIYESAAKFFGWDPSTTHQKNNFANRKKSSALPYDPLVHTQQFKDAFRNCKTDTEIAEVFIRERKSYRLRD
ncbi:MAG: 4-phosphoerythronate dehydrogenase [Gammaproteobacteria bacterium]|nr:4-phosphoerythronate dehydrogenase [Gammaproteobacteria bacterium]